MKIALHGASASVHDHVAGVPGDFDRVCAEVETVSSFTVTTGVTRANARSLAALAGWLVAPRRLTKLERWTLSWPGSQPDGLAPPRLGMVAPRVLHAAALGRRAGLTVVTEGLPICVLGPHAQHHVATAPRTHAEICGRCTARARCEGVPANYLEQFGRDLELRPLST